MRDLLFPVLTAGFFALAALAVVACERLVGVEPSRADTEGEAE